MKRIKDLQPGDRIDGGVFAVSVVEHKVVNDFSFITLTLADCSGKRLASLLNYSLEQYQLLLDSPIICVQGEVQTEKKYRGQIKISSCVSVPVPADVSPFVEPLRENNPALREHFCVLLGSIQEPSLGKLLHFIFDPGKGLLEDFCVAVAADKRHHAYRGGLLEHTLEVAELCDAVCRVMPCLDRDLLLACALLHDIGKLEEMEHGIRSGQYTASGSLIGHVVSGAHRVGRFAEKLPGGFPVRLKETLMHMILSHHGTVEYGAARPPAFAEAQVLSQCDMISAQVVQYVDARADADGALSVWMPGREGRRAFVGDLGTQPLPAPDVVREASPMYVTKHQDAPYPNAEPLSFTTARRLPVLGLVAAGSPGQSSDEEQEAREVVPPFAGADYLLRVTGDSMKDAGMHEGDLLFVRHQKEANNGDIVVAHLAAQGQVVKKLRRGGGSEVWLDSQNSQADYPPSPSQQATKYRAGSRDCNATTDEAHKHRRMVVTPTLDLPSEQETELQKQAAAEGLAPDRYALDLLLEQIQQKAKARPFYETATTEEWIAAFHEWTHSHDPNGAVLLDDSREVIYED